MDARLKVGWPAERSLRNMAPESKGGRWTCTVLESGERKSALVPKMIRPVERYEERQRRRILDERKGIENRREVFERVRRETIKDAAGDPDMLHQADEVQARLDELEIPEPPRTRAGNSERIRRR